MQKIDMSIAIVCMVNQTAIKQMQKASFEQNLNFSSLQNTTLSVTTVQNDACVRNMMVGNGTKKVYVFMIIIYQEVFTEKNSRKFT